MKVIVAGSREITDPSVISAAIQASGFQISELVSGAARGVDQLGESWAQERGIPVRRFPADWSHHGKAAGPLRNEEMAVYGDALVAVWNGKSRGTASMISLARKHGLKVHIHQSTQGEPNGA